MKTPVMKITTIGLTALLGSFGNLLAIERPNGGAAKKEEIPAQPSQFAEPQGGILGNDQKAGGPESQQAAEKPQMEGAEKIPQLAEMAYLGVSGSPASNVLLMHLQLESALLLTFIDPTSPAGLAGLKKNDLLLSVAGKSLTDQVSLREALIGEKPGAEVLLKLVRGGKVLDQKITLGSSPYQAQARNLQRRPRGMQMRGLDFDSEELMQLLRDRLGAALQGGAGNQGFQVQPFEQEEMMERLGQFAEEMGEGFAKGGQFQKFKFKLGGPDQGARLMGNNLRFDLGQGIRSMRLEDDECVIELKTEEDSSEVKIFDKDGALIFEGPYDSEIDKSAVPEQYQERVEQLASNTTGSFFGFGGQKKEEQQKGEKKGE